MIVVCGSGVKTKPNTHNMKGKRRRRDPEFKARVTIEALKGVFVENTLKIASREAAH
jgi:hypothetical protein